MQRATEAQVQAAFEGMVAAACAISTRYRTDCARYAGTPPEFVHDHGRNQMRENRQLVPVLLLNQLTRAVSAFRSVMEQRAVAPVPAENLGLTAVLLVKLDAHRGEWLPLELLSTKLGMNRTSIAQHCEQLEHAGQLQVRRCDAGAVTHARAALTEA